MSEVKSESSTNSFLSFEGPVLVLENQIKELESMSEQKKVNLQDEIAALKAKAQEMMQSIYQDLSIWDRVLLSRHPARPHAVDYIQHLVNDFYELKGDRSYAEDSAILAGFGHLRGKRVAVIAIEKGRKTKEKILHNFGMPRPEGYRKALRVMKLAEQFSLPIITLIDTPGAFPGLEAEARGQSQAIAENLESMFQLSVPIISVVIGEGGSGGALALAIADKVFMQEYATYSVISPESCASILWSDAKKGEQAAEALKLTAEKALSLRVIDDIIEEPLGGAHRDHTMASHLLADAVELALGQLEQLDRAELLQLRFKKFRSIGNQTITF